MTDRIPRFIVSASNGARFLLDASRQPIAVKPGKDARGRTIDPGERIEKITAERDLWPFGVSPKNCPHAAWEVETELRRWGLRE